MRSLLQHALLATLLLCGCTEQAQTPAASAPAASRSALDATSKLSPTRQLRRITLTLKGVEPELADYSAITSAADDTARKAILDKAIDDGLSSNEFYDQ
ncbi:MAG: hypothetical protein ACJ790_10720, partial [Myxococcaceae bacterium]